MYFTLAISAASRERCAALVSAARDTDPRVMPVPGPVRVGWQAPDECTAILHWGAPDSSGASHAGTIWISVPPGVLRARTGLARVDPVYLAETPGAVVVGDRASWVAAVTGRLDDHDPVMVGAFLSVGYPIGAATPFRGVRWPRERSPWGDLPGSIPSGARSPGLRSSKPSVRWALRATGPCRSSCP